MIRFQRILFPTDFSEASLQALHYAADLARFFDAQLFFVHVVQAPPMPADYNFGTEVMDYAASLRERAEQQLDGLIEDAGCGGRATKILVQGEPAGAILGTAAEFGVDLIVLATHGTTGWRHMLFGSVAEKVVRLSAIPVLTVNERLARARAEAETAEPALVSAH
jgi:nucleotide-binding universal stress UspA family protein